MRPSTVRWIFVAILFAAALWSANLTLYNWWAAGGPPTPTPQLYATRGNIFAVVTLLFLGAAGGLGLMNWKQRAR
jgi:hypothetical protein